MEYRNRSVAEMFLRQALSRLQVGARPRWQLHNPRLDGAQPNHANEFYPMMKANIEALAEAGLRDEVKVMVGGAPVTEAFASEIGADIWAPDASLAATRARGGVA